MILLTLGTHDQPFERAIDAVAALKARGRLVVQHGHTRPRPELPAEWRQFVERDEMLELTRSATAVVCHAGVGCIMTTLSLGRMPVVIPRLSRYGEHVDDHQLQIAREMEAAGMVVVSDGHDLDAAIARTFGGLVRVGGDGALQHAVARATAREICGRPRRRLLRTRREGSPEPSV